MSDILLNRRREMMQGVHFADYYAPPSIIIPYIPTIHSSMRVSFMAADNIKTANYLGYFYFRLYGSQNSYYLMTQKSWGTFIGAILNNGTNQNIRDNTYILADPKEDCMFEFGYYFGLNRQFHGVIGNRQNKAVSLSQPTIYPQYTDTFIIFVGSHYYRSWEIIDDDVHFLFRPAYKENGEIGIYEVYNREWYS